MTHSLTDREISGRPADSRKPKYEPRWIRLVTRGHCPITGLSRAAAYDLIRQGKIKSACIRKPGAVRGQRLVYLPSVLELLDRCADQESKHLKSGVNS